MEQFTGGPRGLLFFSSFSVAAVGLEPPLLREGRSSGVQHERGSHHRCVSHTIINSSIEMEGSGLFDTFFWSMGGQVLNTNSFFYLTCCSICILRSGLMACIGHVNTYWTLISQWVLKCLGHHSGSPQVSKLMAVKYAATWNGEYQASLPKDSKMLCLYLTGHSQHR